MHNSPATSTHQRRHRETSIVTHALLTKLTRSLERYTPEPLRCTNSSYIAPCTNALSGMRPLAAPVFLRRVTHCTAAFPSRPHVSTAQVAHAGPQHDLAASVSTSIEWGVGTASCSALKELAVTHLARPHEPIICIIIGVQPRRCPPMLTPSRPRTKNPGETSDVIADVNVNDSYRDVSPGMTQTARPRRLHHRARASAVA